METSSKVYTQNNTTKKLNEIIHALLNAEIEAQNKILTELFAKSENPKELCTGLISAIENSIVNCKSNSQMYIRSVCLISKIENHVWPAAKSSNTKILSFAEIKQTVDGLPTTNEKLIYLLNQKTYQIQYYLTTGIEIPENKIALIDCEIKRIKEIAEIIEAYPSQTKATHKLASEHKRIAIRGQVNQLVNIFYELSNVKVNGASFFQANLTDLARLIAANFADKDGHPISEATARTILSPNKIDKRPKFSPNKSLAA